MAHDESHEPEREPTGRQQKTFCPVLTSSAGPTGLEGWGTSPSSASPMGVRGPPGLHVLYARRLCDEPGRVLHRANP